MSQLVPRVFPTIRTLVEAWRARGPRAPRLVRDAALWLRAPAGRRPAWRDQD